MSTHIDRSDFCIYEMNLKKRAIVSGRPHSAIIKRNVKADENTFDKDNNAATLGGVAVAHIDGGRHQTKEFELFQPTFSGISNATLTTKSC